MKWIMIGAGSLAGVVAAMALVGSWLPKGHRVSRSIQLKQMPETIWRTITDVAAFPEWRPDVSRVEPLPGRKGMPAWREIGKNGAIAIEAIEFSPPHRLVGRIADPSLPFGGTWTYEVQPVDQGTVLTVTENGEVYNVLFRFLSRYVFGHASTVETYLGAVARKFGEDRVPADPS